MNAEKIYNTGKVLIGRKFEPDTRPYHDADAIELQRALLKVKSDHGDTPLAWVLGVLFAVVLLTLVGVL